MMKLHYLGFSKQFGKIILPGLAQDAVLLAATNVKRLESLSDDKETMKEHCRTQPRLVLL